MTCMSKVCAMMFWVTHQCTPTPHNYSGEDQFSCDYLFALEAIQENGVCSCPASGNHMRGLSSYMDSESPKIMQEWSCRFLEAAEAEEEHSPKPLQEQTPCGTWRNFQQAAGGLSTVPEGKWNADLWEHGSQGTTVS